MKRMFQNLSNTERAVTIIALIIACISMSAFALWYTSLNGRSWHDWVLVGGTPLVFLGMFDSLMKITFS